MTAHGLQYVFFGLILATCAWAELCTDVGVTVDTTIFSFPLRQIEILETMFNQTSPVVALTMDGFVHYSSNGGRDWEDITPQLENYWKHNAVGQAGISRIIPCPVSATGRTYLLGFASYYWTLELLSTGTLDINSYEASSPLLDLVPNPRNDSSAMMTAVPLGCDMDLSDYACRSVLYETVSFGAVWVAVADSVHQFAWNDAGDRMFFISVPRDSPQEGGQFCTATISGSDINVIASSGAVEFAYEGGVVFLVVFTEDTAVEVERDPSFRYQLKVSDNDGHSFVDAHFSSGTSAFAEENTAGEFTLADVSFGTTFINVERTDIRWGSLYVARTEDASFYVTLQFNLLSNGVADFAPIQLQAESGIFLANTYDVSPLASLNDYSTIVRTMATFDKGGVWHTIPSPINCTTECSLNLRGPADSDQPQILSMSSAAGLVLASGNIGLYRAPAAHDKVFLSRSAGYRWEEVLSSPHLYTMADQGSLFLALPFGESTGTLKYSWNQASSWDTCVLTENLYDVDDIITIGEITSTTFLVSGIRYDEASPKGVVQYIDFTSGALPRECVGLAAPDSNGSDFETWTAAVDGSCLLGRATTYVRRKRDSVCYISGAFDAYDPSLDEVCPCTREDYMCDGACYQKGEDGACDYICIDMVPTEEDCTEGYRMETQGYVLVPGDVCMGGLDLGAVEVACEVDAGEAYWKTVVALWLTASCFVMIALVFVLAAVLYAMRSNEKLNKIIAPVIPAWCTEDTGTLCCGGRGRDDDEEDGFYAQLGGQRSAGSLVDDDDDMDSF